MDSKIPKIIIFSYFKLQQILLILKYFKALNCLGINSRSFFMLLQITLFLLRSPQLEPYSKHGSDNERRARDDRILKFHRIINSTKIFQFNGCSEETVLPAVKDPIAIKLVILVLLKSMPILPEAQNWTDPHIKAITAPGKLQPRSGMKASCRDKGTILVKR